MNFLICFKTKIFPFSNAATARQVSKGFIMRKFLISSSEFKISSRFILIFVLEKKFG